jgi:hypothetical protein
MPAPWTINFTGEDPAVSDALTEIDKAAKTDVVFMAKYGNYKLVRKPRRRTFSEVGTVLRDEPPIRYQFRNHILRVRPGRDLNVDDETQLAEGEDTGIERDGVTWLKAHPQFGKTFWVEGEEPNKPRPFEHEVLKAMNEAVVALDVDRLRELLDAERSTHNRPLLTGALTSAVEAISRAAAEAVAQQEVPVSGDGENALEWSEGYNKDKLQEVADAAGIEVKGTGADGAVLKEDLVKALRRETKKAREK